MDVRGYYYLSQAVAAPVGTTYVDEVLADSPSLYLRMGEPSGTTLVAEVGPNGTYVNSPTLAQSGALANDSDTAVRFVRASYHHATVADNAALNLGDVFSIEFWVKLNSTGLNQHITMKGTTGSFRVLVGTDNSVILTLASGGGGLFGTNSSIGAGEWHHVVLTKSGSTRVAYLNSTADTYLGTNQTLVDTATSLFVGVSANDGTTNALDGWLDEVALYKTALSAARVAAHYDAGV